VLRLRELSHPTVPLLEAAAAQIGHQNSLESVTYCRSISHAIGAKGAQMLIFSQKIYTDQHLKC
jgi:hypothetical protein